MQKLNITIDMQEHADMLNQKLVAPVFFFSGFINFPHYHLNRKDFLGFKSIYKIKSQGAY